MLHVYEFEVFKDGDFYLAFPFDMEGGTQGETFEEVCEMAVDWLKIDMEHRAMHEIPFPTSTFGNELQHGGERLVVAVEAGRDTVEKMTASEAARRLGVTPGRVSQMMKSCQLEGFKEGGTVWITKGSVDARLEEAPKAGRPRKKIEPATDVA